MVDHHDGLGVSLLRVGFVVATWSYLPFRQTTITEFREVVYKS